MTVRTGSYAKIEFPPTIGHDLTECQTWHQLRGHELTQLVDPAYFLTLLALTLLPAFRPSPIFFASSLRTAAYFGATIG